MNFQLGGFLSLFSKSKPKDGPLIQSSGCLQPNASSNHQASYQETSSNPLAPYNALSQLNSLDFIKNAGCSENVIFNFTAGCVSPPPHCEPPPCPPPHCEPPPCPPPHCEPPPCPPPHCEPPPCPPPHCAPPPCPPPAAPNNYLYIAGDPTVGGNFNSFNFNPTPGQPFNLISDPDNQLSINVQTHVINPQGKQGIQQSDISVNGQSVQFANDGTLYVNGVAQGNINNAGSIGPIDLGNGCTVGTENVVDDAAGDLRKRFVLNTPEYQYTAALRQPQGAGAYYDINLAENVGNAANDATGSSFAGEGNTSAASILRGQKPLTG